MSTVAETLTKFKPEPCSVTGTGGGGGYDNSNVTMTGGDWPSAVKDVYTWVASVYKVQTTEQCGGVKCTGARGEGVEYKNRVTNTNLLPPETQGKQVPIDCSGAAWQAIRSYWYRMKMNNSPGFDETKYKEIMKTSAIGSAGFAKKDNKHWDLLRTAGFEILEFEASKVQPWDIIAMPPQNPFGHVNIVGEKGADGVWTIYNATTNHKPDHKVIHQSKNPHSDFGSKTSNITTIIRLKR